MKVLLVCIIMFLGLNEIKQQPISVVYTREEIVIPYEQQIYLAYLEVAKCLSINNRISVTPEYFATSCLIIGWCESGLRIDAESNGQQGIPQFTKSTRRLLGLPKDITSKSFLEQIEYHHKFFLSVDQNLLKEVKTVYDLHMLNFKPFGVRRSKVSKNNKQLDINKDNIINVKDIILFQKRQIKNNKIIKQMYHGL